jgi:hypothetical protein
MGQVIAAFFLTLSVDVLRKTTANTTSRKIMIAVRATASAGMKNLIAAATIKYPTRPRKQLRRSGTVVSRENSRAVLQ